MLTSLSRSMRLRSLARSVRSNVTVQLRTRALFSSDPLSNNENDVSELAKSLEEVLHFGADDHDAFKESLQSEGIDRASIALSEERETPHFTRERVAKRQAVLQQKLKENLPPQFEKLKGYVPVRETVTNIGQLELYGRERELYELHLSDPVVWDVKAVAEKYRISRIRAKAVIMLEELHDKRVEAGDYYTNMLDLSEDPTKKPKYDPSIRLDMSDYEFVDPEEETPDKEQIASSKAKEVEDFEAVLNSGGTELAADATEATQPAADAASESTATVAEGGETTAAAEGEGETAEEESAPQSPHDLKAAKLRAEILELAMQPYDEDDESYQAQVWEEPTAEDIAYFKQHGYFADNVQTAERKRFDIYGQAMPRAYFARDDETIEEVIAFKDSVSTTERPVDRKLPFAPKASEVPKTINYEPESRFKRKLIVRDISNGGHRNKVKVMDHSGKLRKPQPRELRHRKQ